ncbi:zinc-ribbon domain-containing protein [Gordonia zhaorongruii]|uniref:zinc-ribbon domain-containing protein n=1 Tax=Gordonia zhaorongruii TaxID=2597659 RepID=UPI001050D5E1|nr:zinc-ribbon domain-containing protein [Gordonia zhaorongruii]
MFFLFGYGTKRKRLGTGHSRSCRNCHNTTDWLRIREYKQFTLFFIPVARWSRREFEECGICGAVIEA